MYDFVDYVFFQKVFGVLEVFWQFFVNGLFDYVWVGKIDQGIWFGQVNIVQYGVGGGYIVGCWIGQDYDIGQVFFFEYFNGDCCMWYLYQ